MFDETEQVLGNNPQIAELMSAAQAGKLARPTADGPKLTKQQTIEAFQKSKELRIQALRDEFTPHADSHDAMLVDKAKMEDKMFFKTGIEDEEFEEALMFYMKDDIEL